MLCKGYYWLLDALDFSFRVHGDIAKSPKRKLMNDCVSFFGISFGVGKLFESGSESSSYAKFYSGIIGQKMLESD